MLSNQLEVFNLGQGCHAAGKRVKDNSIQTHTLKATNIHTICMHIHIYTQTHTHTYTYTNTNTHLHTSNGAAPTLECYRTKELVARVVIASYHFGRS